MTEEKKKHAGGELSENPPRAIISGVNCWCRHDAEVDITELIENPRNPNKHPDKQIALLAKIIRNQGWRQPITVSKRSGFIVKGHGRLAAARVLNVENVPIEYQEYETEAQEYADLMADNRIAELAEPDEDMIAELSNDDLFDGFDMDLTGFDSDDIGVFDVDEVEPPSLSDGDKEPFQQITLTMHDSQADEFKRAIEIAKSNGGGKSSVNDNSNGNAASFIAEVFLNGQG